MLPLRPSAGFVSAGTLSMSSAMRSCRGLEDPASCGPPKSLLSLRCPNGARPSMVSLLVSSSAVKALRNPLLPVPAVLAGEEGDSSLLVLLGQGLVGVCSFPSLWISANRVFTTERCPRTAIEGLTGGLLMQDGG